MILDTRPLKQVTTLDDFTLIVTADNIGSYKKGAEKTKLYTKNALGNWKLDTFQGGELKYVNAPGIYKTILSINDISKYKGETLLPRFR